MWNGKRKAVTFSFDDGVTQDIDTIKILDDYGLKATFNLNSGLFGWVETVSAPSKKTPNRKSNADEIKEIYKNHEVAVHTLTHPNLTALSKDEVIRQVEEDRKTLESLVGYDVRVMAYPCGGVNNDQRTAEIIKENTPIKMARTITSNYSFDLQTNLLQFNPTVYYAEKDKTFELAEKFINLETEKDQIFYIWGHTYEMDEGKIDWKYFKDLCKLIGGKADIYYGTNTETVLNR